MSFRSISRRYCKFHMEADGYESSKFVQTFLPQDLSKNFLLEYHPDISSGNSFFLKICRRSSRNFFQRFSQKSHWFFARKSSLYFSWRFPIINLLPLKYFASVPLENNLEDPTGIHLLLLQYIHHGVLQAFLLGFLSRFLLKFQRRFFMRLLQNFSALLPGFLLNFLLRFVHEVLLKYTPGFFSINFSVIYPEVSSSFQDFCRRLEVTLGYFHSIFISGFLQELIQELLSEILMVFPIGSFFSNFCRSSSGGFSKVPFGFF